MLFDLFTLGTVNLAPREFWREHESQYPTLACLARDIFSIPATGAGVERLFNSARDICHYRRGSLNATTIQDLMMFRCISKFDLEVEEDLDAEDIIMTPEDRQAYDERREARLPLETPDPISDDEDNRDSLGPPVEIRSQRALGKRRKSIASQSEEGEASQSDDEANLPLPNTQQRVSGRNRKRSRREDDVYAYY